MRLHSTVESAYSGQITILAIMECIFSVFIYFAIGVYFHTYLFYYIAILLAPFSLLRTNRSSFHAWGGGYTIRLLLSGRRLLFKFILFWSIGAPLIRILTLINDVIKHPVDAIKSMPENWLRQALCTDMYHPPEILPLENAYAKQFPLAKRLPTFSEVVRTFMENTPSQKNDKKFAIARYVMFLFFLMPYIPSIIYRITFKSTSIVYIPLVWASYVIYGHKEPWPYIPKRIIDGKLEKHMRTISGFLGILFLCKLGLVAGGSISNIVPGEFLHSIFTKNIIRTSTWSFWELVLGANVVLTFLIYFAADWVISVSNTISDKMKNMINSVFSIIVFLRWSISIMVILYLVLVTLYSVI
jgi:hypothetical protein